MNENGTLFDLDEYTEPKERKAPQSHEEKRLREIQAMEDREFRNLQIKLNCGKTLTAVEAKRLDEYKARLEERAGTDLPEGVVRTAKEVAEHFGKSIRTIRYWTGKGMPVETDGYDLGAIETWGIAQGLIQQQATTQTGGNEDGLASESRAYYEREIKRLDSELREIKLARTRGQMFLREDVAGEWASRAKIFCNALDHMETRLPPLLEGKTQAEMRPVIRMECRKVREDLLRPGDFCPVEDEG